MNPTNGTGGNGSANITYTFLPPQSPVDTDLRIRVLGLAANYAIDTGWEDPIELAELMLAFVEGRSANTALDITTEADEDEVDTDEYDEDVYEDWYTTVSGMLGKRVRITLATEADGTKVICEGTLLGFGDTGEFEIQEDDGYVHYCWPMLDIELVEDSDA